MWIAPLKEFYKLPGERIIEPFAGHIPIYDVIPDQQDLVVDKNWMFFTNNGQLFAQFLLRPFIVAKVVRNDESNLFQVEEYYRNHYDCFDLIPESQHVHHGTNLVRVAYSPKLAEYNFTRDIYINIVHTKLYTTPPTYEDFFVVYDTESPFAPIRMTEKYKFDLSPFNVHPGSFIYTNSMNTDKKIVQVNEFVDIGCGVDDNSFAFFGMMPSEMLALPYTTCNIKK